MTFRSYIHIVIATVFLSLAGFFPVHSDEIWTKTFNKAPDWYHLTSGGNLLLSDKGTLMLYEARSGRILWQRNDIAASSSRDITDVAGARLMLGEIIAPVTSKKKKRRRRKNTPLLLTAIDRASGENLWQLDGIPGSIIDVIPLTEENKLLVFERYKPRDKKQRGIYVSARDIDTGKSLWRTRLYELKGPLSRYEKKKPKGLSAWPEMTVRDGIAYLPYQGAHALRLDNGALLWGHKLHKNSPAFIHTIAPLVVTEDRVYATGRSAVYAYDRKSGAQIWKGKVRGAKVIPELALTSSRLLVRFGGIFSDMRKISGLKSYGVAALDLKNGKSLWNYRKAKGGITNLVIQEEKNRIIFADANSITALRLSSGKIAFMAPLAFYRQYGVFKAKKSGFSLGGSFAKMNPAGKWAGKGGSIGGGGCSMNIGDLPIEIREKGEEIIVRGQHHIMTFDPRVMLTQWSVIFSATNPEDRTLLRRGHLPVYSDKNRSYFLTELNVGAGRRSRVVLSLLGISKKDGKVLTRQDIGGKKPRFLIDHAHDRLIRIIRGKKRSLTFRAISL